MAGGITNGVRGYNFNEGMFNDNGTIGTVAEIIESGTTGNVSAADFALPAKYRAIDFIFPYFSPISGGHDIHVQLSDDGGATFKAGASDYRYNCVNVSTSTANDTFLCTNSNGDSKMLVATNLVATLGQAARFTVRVMGYEIAGTTVSATTIYSSGVRNISAAGPPSGMLQSFGRRNAAETHNAIRFLMSSGNLQAEYLVIGYRNS
jgi:hypothetical protein